MQDIRELALDLLAKKRGVSRWNYPNPRLMRILLENDDQMVPDEDSMWVFLMAWLDRDSQARVVHGRLRGVDMYSVRAEHVQFHNLKEALVRTKLRRNQEQINAKGMH